MGDPPGVNKLDTHIGRDDLSPYDWSRAHKKGLGKGRHQFRGIRGKVLTRGGIRGADNCRVSISTPLQVYPTKFTRHGGITKQSPS